MAGESIDVLAKKYHVSKSSIQELNPALNFDKIGKPYAVKVREKAKTHDKAHKVHYTTCTETHYYGVGYRVFIPHRELYASK